MSISMQPTATAAIALLFLFPQLARPQDGGAKDHEKQVEPGKKKKRAQEGLQIKFVDVAKKSGIDYVNLCGEPDKPRLIDTLGSGLAWFDYDGDGWLDLFVPNGSRLDALQGKTKNTASDKLYRNKGDGTFEDVTGKAGLVDDRWGLGVAVGDYDRDGDEDLYVCNLGAPTIGGNFLYRNNGNGTFTDVAKELGVDFPGCTPGAAWGDVDLDGDLDLYVSRYLDFQLNNPGAPLAKTMRGMKVMLGPKGLLGGSDKLFLNEVDEKTKEIRFREVTKEAGLLFNEKEFGFTIQILDMNEDDLPDIFVANDMTPNHYYQAVSKGSFKSRGAESGLAVDCNGQEQACMGIALGDLNEDQVPDMVITNFTAEFNAVYLSSGKGVWEDTPDVIERAHPAKPWVKWGAGLFDLDLDADEDLLFYSGHVFPQLDTEDPPQGSYREPALLYRCDGKLDFTWIKGEPDSPLQVKRCARGSAYADYDEDGDVDVAVFNMDAPMELWRNETVTPGHWLKVALQGKTSNLDGYGARVTLEAGGKRQTRWVLGQGSFISQNDKRAHFGLGAATQADKLVVRWPGGKEDVIAGPLPVDRTLLVREGEGKATEVSRPLAPHK